MRRCRPHLLPHPRPNTRPRRHPFPSSARSPVPWARARPWDARKSAWTPPTWPAISRRQSKSRLAASMRNPSSCPAVSADGCCARAIRQERDVEGRRVALRADGKEWVAARDDGDLCGRADDDGNPKAEGLPDRLGDECRDDVQTPSTTIMLNSAAPSRSARAATYSAEL